MTCIHTQKNISTDRVLHTESMAHLYKYWNSCRWNLPCLKGNHVYTFTFCRNRSVDKRISRGIRLSTYRCLQKNEDGNMLPARVSRGVAAPGEEFVSMKLIISERGLHNCVYNHLINNNIRVWWSEVVCLLRSMYTYIL